VTHEQLAQHFDDQLGRFAADYPSVPAPTSNRTHCVQWIDFASEADIEAARGIRLDANYYYYPGDWIRDRPGLFTGSGLPMRLARADGTVIDTYQIATQFTDDSRQSIPRNVDVVLDNAVGPRGFYGTFMCNVHHELDSDHVALDILASAKAHGAPVISAQQLLTWVDGRNASTVRDLAWDGSTLTFVVGAAEGARGLVTMIPLVAGGDSLRSMKHDGEPIHFVAETVKGIAYARFESPSGRYEAVYLARAVGTSVPGMLELSSVTPNPGRGDVTFTITLKARGEARLALYGIRGNLVRTLARGTQAAGPSAFVWNRRDDAGRRMPSGVYLARLEGLGETHTSRVVLLP
jgi:hypothetical protein